MTTERPEHRAARQLARNEETALAQDHRHRILSRLRPAADPDTEARAAATVAHLTEEQP